MHNIKVASLTYKIEQRGKVRIATDTGICRSVTLNEFTGNIEPRSAVFKPTLDFFSVDEARAALEPQLRSWRAWVRLTELDDFLAFEFSSAAREASSSIPDGQYILVVEPAHIEARGSVTSMILTRNNIPDPPRAFCCDELVEVGLALYADAVSMPRHALKFSYAFLTSSVRTSSGKSPVTN